MQIKSIQLDNRAAEYSITTQGKLPNFGQTMKIILPTNSTKGQILLILIVLSRKMIPFFFQQNIRQLYDVDERNRIAMANERANWRSSTATSVHV